MICDKRSVPTVGVSSKGRYPLTRALSGVGGLSSNHRLQKQLPLKRYSVSGLFPSLQIHTKKCKSARQSALGTARVHAGRMGRKPVVVICIKPREHPSEKTLPRKAPAGSQHEAAQCRREKSLNADRNATEAMVKLCSWFPCLPRGWPGLLLERKRRNEKRSCLK